jgi:hypothetical protein
VYGIGGAAFLIAVATGRIAGRGSLWIWGAMWIAVMGSILWDRYRLFDVWLVGDMLEVSGPAEFRVPLSAIRSIELGTGRIWSRRTRRFVLTLNEPIGRIDTIRFLPQGYATAGDMGDRTAAWFQERFDATRASRSRSD